MRVWLFNAALVVVVLVVAAYARSADQKAQRLAVETHSALCAFKADLGERQRASVQYVADVRNGVREPIRGITLAELDQAIANRQATLDSLASLDCS